MNFLYNQEKFTTTFGNLPSLMSSKPKDSDYGLATAALRNYVNKWKLDICMHLWMLDYVGTDKIDPSFNVAEVCCQLSEVKQVRFHNGKLHTDTPDELYANFRYIAVSLPDNASTWSL